MKRPRHPLQESAAAEDCNAIIAPRDFTIKKGNARELRVLRELLRRPMPREVLDRTAGASNGPDVVAELRRRGLAVPCDRVPCFDRDGHEVRRGVYHATASDRRAIYRAFAKWTQEGE